MTEYQKRRSETPERADALFQLGSWCQDHGLAEQAAAHFIGVLKLDSSRELAWRHLGYKKHGKHWLKLEDVAAAKQNLAAQRLADRSWKTKLEKMRDWLQSKDAAKRAKAEQEMSAVTDPRAVPMIWLTFVRGSAGLQKAAARMLRQIDGPAASSGLAALAVFSSFADVRTQAIDALKRRDPRDVAGRLIAMIHKPYKYDVRPSKSPSSPGDLVVHGEDLSGRWSYEDRLADHDLMATLGAGRVATADVPFEPFTLQNMLAAALGQQYASLKNQFGQAMGPGGMRGDFPITIEAPLSASSAAQSLRAAVANPQNAGAIINQLMTDPDNRTMPPLMWYVLANQNTVLDHTAPHPGATHHSTVDYFRPADQNGNAVDPMKAAMALQRRYQIETDPAHFTSNLALEIMIEAQSVAAARDRAIGESILAARQAKLSLEQKLAMDIQMIEAINDGIKMTNLRVLPVLTAITGQDFGAEPEKWKSWWVAQLGHGTPAGLATSKGAGAHLDARESLPSVFASLASDTVVHTIEGPRAIETIKVGERVLSQDTATGKMAFQPVKAVISHPAAATLKVRAGGQSIATTGLLRFWRAGKGWAMARDLKPGDRLRVAGDTVTVESVEPDAARTVCNVIVAEHGDIFAGTNKVLVHDNSVVRPVFQPFDRSVDLAPPKKDTR